MLDFKCLYCQTHLPNSCWTKGRVARCTYCHRLLKLSAKTGNVAVVAAEKKDLDEEGEATRSADPWYYGFTRFIAGLLAILGIIGTIPVVEEMGRVGLLRAVIVLVAGVAISLVVPALFLIFADIGRTLR